MCKTAFHYEIVCITVIRWAPAHCSMCQSPRWAISETVGRLSLFFGHIWHGLYGSYNMRSGTEVIKISFDSLGESF